MSFAVRSFSFFFSRLVVSFAIFFMCLSFSAFYLVRFSLCRIRLIIIISRSSSSGSINVMNTELRQYQYMKTAFNCLCMSLQTFGIACNMHIAQNAMQLYNRHSEFDVRIYYFTPDSHGIGWPTRQMHDRLSVTPILIQLTYYWGAVDFHSVGVVFFSFALPLIIQSQSKGITLKKMTIICSSVFFSGKFAFDNFAPTRTNRRR